MSTSDSQDQSARSDTAADPARIQPWFAVMGLSLLPGALSFYLPDGFRIPLLTATGVLYLIGCVMLFRQTKKTPRDTAN